MRKIKILIASLLLLCGFQQCHQASTSSFAKAAISSSCSNTINFSVSGDNVFAEYPGVNYNVGGEGTDELGIIFYVTGPGPGTYDLSGVSALLYWDPGNDGIDEYGSISGQLIVNSVNYVNGVIQSIDITFNNVTVKNFSTGDTKCVNAGHIYFKLL